jgi:hypothetical protein
MGNMAFLLCVCDDDCSTSFERHDSKHILAHSIACAVWKHSAFNPTSCIRCVAAVADISGRGDKTPQHISTLARGRFGADITEIVLA